MERDSFVFYRSFYEAIKDLPRDIQGEVYTAIMEYGLNGITTENLKPVARSIFTLIKPVLEFGNKQYANGLRGGRPRKNENPDNAQKNPTETQQKPTQNPTETQPEPYKDEDVDKERENIEQSKIALSGCPAPPTPEAINFDNLVAYFNEKTKGVFGTVRLPISEKRKTLIRARIREHGKNGFARMVELAMESDFLKGQNSHRFTATFDWLILPTNFEKVLSGNYSNYTADTAPKGRDIIGSEFTSD